MTDTPEEHLATAKRLFNENQRLPVVFIPGISPWPAVFYNIAAETLRRAKEQLLLEWTKDALSANSDKWETSLLIERRSRDMTEIHLVARIKDQDAYIKDLEEDRSKLENVCRAVVDYDNSILGRATNGEYDLREGGGGVANGDDLDKLYFAMVDGAKRVMKTRHDVDKNSA